MPDKTLNTSLYALDGLRERTRSGIGCSRNPHAVDQRRIDELDYQSRKIDVSRTRSGAHLVYDKWKVLGAPPRQRTVSRRLLKANQRSQHPSQFRKPLSIALHHIGLRKETLIPLYVNIKVSTFFSPYMGTDDHCTMVWRAPGKRHNRILANEWHTSLAADIIFWRAVACDCRSAFFFLLLGTWVSGSWTRPYVPHLLQFLAGIPGAIFQRVNARPHAARALKDCLRLVETSSWRARSPDVFPSRACYPVFVTRRPTFVDPPSASGQHPASDGLLARSCCIVYLSARRRDALLKMSAPQHLKSNPMIPIKAPYDRVKRCRERKTYIKASERVNVDVFTQNKRPCPQHSHAPIFNLEGGELFCPDRDSSPTGILSPLPPVSPPPPEQTRDRDSYESARATRRRRARTQLTSLSAVKPGSISGRGIPKFLQIIVPDDAAGRRVSSGISRFSCPFIPALLHPHLALSSSALKTSVLETANPAFVSPIAGWWRGFLQAASPGGCCNIVVIPGVLMYWKYQARRDRLEGGGREHPLDVRGRTERSWYCSEEGAKGRKAYETPNTKQRMLEYFPVKFAEKSYLPGHVRTGIIVQHHTTRAHHPRTFFFMAVTTEMLQCFAVYLTVEDGPLLWKLDQQRSSAIGEDS
ncbi:hypothetical protein PR048_032261 [Dryococelus australis]|uniref:Uncharacterized protein n=1 Tax=Dryococelus australis TaxID=614101 RepID=A0ABQ9G2J6_9NEOP|nr:hypothetical protein PR048_032261 [Dryococelus australis]